MKFKQEILNQVLRIVVKSMACEANNEPKSNICSLLLTTGAKVEYRSSHILVHYCCYNGNNTLLQQALERQTQEELVKILGHYERVPHGQMATPLLCSILGRQWECFGVILQQYVTTRTVVSIRHCIETAIETGQAAMLQQLLDHHTLCQAEVSGYAVITDWAITTAYYSKHFECAKLLIQYSTNLAWQMGYDTTIWDVVISHAQGCSHSCLNLMLIDLATLCNWECVQYLLQDRYVHLFSLNSTLLVRVIAEQKYAVLGAILRHEVDLNSLCTHGSAPLMHAMFWYEKVIRSLTSWNILKMLVKHGADVNAISTTRVNNQVHTFSQKQVAPITVASHPEVMELLILAGAKSPMVNSEGLNHKLDVDVIINCRQPPALTHLCRLSIRAACRIRHSMKINKLTGILPPALLQYLMLPEVRDIEEKYNLTR